EDYVTSASAVASGASISESETKKTLEKLKTLLKRQGLTLEDIIWELQEMLPGIQSVYDRKKNPDGWKVFSGVSDKSVRKWIARRRLGSPQHFRYYFALVQPQGVFTDEDVLKLVTLAVVSRSDATAMIASAASTKRSAGGVALDPLLSRLL